MQNLWNTISNAVLDLNVSQAITLGVVALVLSGATAGLFRLLSRGKTDVTAMLTSLVLVSSLISMLIAAAYLGYGRPRETRKNQAAIEGEMRNSRHGVAIEMVDNLVVRILMEYDTNRDGRLSAEEAAAGASQLVTEPSAGGSQPGSLDREGLRSVLLRRFFMPPMPPPPSPL